MFVIKTITSVIKIIKWCLISSLMVVALYRFVPVYITPLMLIRSTGAIFDHIYEDVKSQFKSDTKGKKKNPTKASRPITFEKDWVPLEDISKNMVRSVLKAEDYKFYDHYGFDFEAIQKAMQYNKTHKRKKGASTISQQTAKNVFLWPSRDWLRKGLEAYFTVLIEFMWSKNRIMEVYLNVIEFGPGVYGVEAASQKYFKKSASKISAAEASLLAAVLPNPFKFKVDRPSAYVLKRQGRILGRVSPEVPKEETLAEFLDIKLDESDEPQDQNKLNKVSEAGIDSKKENPQEESPQAEDLMIEDNNND